MFIIIGASSFIGVYTATYFIEHGESVLVTGRDDKFKEYYYGIGAKYINLDLTNPSDFNKLPTRDIEGVILISGALPASENADLENMENADKYIKVNTLGVCYVLEFCRKNGIKRLINTTSYADVANSLRTDPPINEDEPRNFSFYGDHSVYVISKCAAADIAAYYNLQHGMKNVWFRLPPVYGVGPHGYLNVNGKIVKSGLQVFIDRAKAGKDIEVYGHLERDVVYVKDVAQAYYKASKSKKAVGLYNISSGHKTSLLEQAEVCAKLYSAGNKKSRVLFYKDHINNGKSYVFSIQKAITDFGYSPNYITFEELMKDYIKEEERGVYTTLFSNRNV